MPDPIWLDNNVLSFALKGDITVIQQLDGYRRQGRALLVTQAAAREILDGNPYTQNPDIPAERQAPSPKHRASAVAGMKQLGVEIDTRAKDIPNERFMKYRKINSPVHVSDSDRLILAEVKASAEARGIAKPQLVTGEIGKKAMVTAPTHWGIESVPHARSASGVQAPPRLNFVDYPENKDGPLSRYFKDRPILKKMGLFGVGVGVQYLTSAMLEAIKKHFLGVADEAEKELRAKCPSPVQIKAGAGLDRHKQAYAAALSKLNTPTNMRAAAAVILALTKDRDIPKTKKHLDNQLSKVRSASGGALRGYSQIAEEYIDALLRADKALSEAWKLNLPDIAADIQKRGSVLEKAGNNLVETYWKYVKWTVLYPLAYYEWMRVQEVGSVFQAVGSRVLSLAADIKDLNASYENLRKQLDDELLKVSEELARRGG